MRAPCPCGEKKTYMQCCKRYLSGKHNAPTAVALMRSRFTAFSKHQSAYIVRTASGTAAATLANQKNAICDENIQWLRLDIQQIIRGEVDDTYGEVEFTAYYRDKHHPKQTHQLHEHSVFEKRGSQWFYTGAL